MVNCIRTHWPVGTFIITVPSIRGVLYITKKGSNCRGIYYINAKLLQKPLELLENILIEGYCGWRFVLNLAG